MCRHRRAASWLAGEDTAINDTSRILYIHTYDVSGLRALETLHTLLYASYISAAAPPDASENITRL